MDKPVMQSWRIAGFRGVVALLFGTLILIWPGFAPPVLQGLFSVYALLTGIIMAAASYGKRQMDEDWGAPFLFGLLSIGAGVMAILRPGFTVFSLALLIAANAMMTGALDLATALKLRRILRNEWLMLLSGFTAILFGMLVFLFPVTGALGIALLVVLYTGITGLCLIGLAFRLKMRDRKQITSRTGERRRHPDRRAAHA